MGYYLLAFPIFSSRHMAVSTLPHPGLLFRLRLASFGLICFLSLFSGPRTIKDGRGREEGCDSRGSHGSLSSAPKVSKARPPSSSSIQAKTNLACLPTYRQPVGRSFQRVDRCEFLLRKLRNYGTAAA